MGKRRAAGGKIMLRKGKYELKNYRRMRKRFSLKRCVCETEAKEGNDSVNSKARTKAVQTQKAEEEENMWAEETVFSFP